ncbi:MAG: F0F1 ATP synthase subunit epsilon [Bacteroidales bacterium]|nr:F0F1 ATP synthase subunit epsilon [Bacteroidales bacterium]
MKFKELTLRILTPEGTVFEGPVEAVWLPGTVSGFEVLPGHAPIISALEKGEVQWRVGGVKSALAIRSGSMILEDGLLTVCAQVGQ